MRARRISLLLAALVTLALVAWTAARDRTEPAPAKATSSPQQASASHPLRAATDAALARDPLVDSDSDPFRVVSLLPPQPTVVALPPPPPPPPKPSAPPFPFRYLGRMVDVNGKPVTYLTRDDELIPVRVNDVLQKLYRIDAMDQQQILVTYLPLDEKVTISIDTPPR